MNAHRHLSHPFANKQLLWAALAAILLTVLAAIPSGQAAAQTDPPEEPIRVVTKEIEPFVFIENGRPVGFSIDIWDEVASDLGLDFEYIIVDTVAEQLQAVELGTADIAVAAVTITESREETVDFTVPFYRSGLGILTRLGSDQPFIAAALATFTSGFLLPIAGLMVALVVIGFVFWLLERKKNPDFEGHAMEGIWDGIWWAAVTVTTVGYGDRTPQSVLGRLLGLVWMFVGLFLIANFTASVAASLTTASLEALINGPQDLPGKSIVTVGGSTADQWLNDQLIPHRRVELIDEAYAMLESGEVDAVVYDYPVLQYFLTSNPSSQLVMVGEPFRTEMYGMAIEQDSQFREMMNRALLGVAEDGRYEDIHEVWFGRREGQ